MSDELTIDGKQYLPSKQAATESGYAQDYIGQLARKGLIDAQRVGGLWYVSMLSLTSYKDTSAEVKPIPPTIPQRYDPDSLVSFDGKDYISASRASKVTGYNQDYIGQLARKGAILSRQIGNRWYIDREGLLAHKSEKDALLASVQRDSVGIGAPAPALPTVNQEGPLLVYKADTRDLLPVIPEKAVENVKDSAPVGGLQSSSTRIPIRIAPVAAVPNESAPEPVTASMEKPRRRYVASAAAAALTIIVVLSYGLLQLNQTQNYAVVRPKSTSAYAASVETAVATLGNLIENIVSPALQFNR